MKKRLYVLTVVVLLGPLFAAPAAHAAPLNPKLLLRHDFPDPDVIEFGGRYYGYGTGSYATRAPVATAPSATGAWTMLGDALPERPAWVAENTGAWAPDVFRRSDGKYLMYFTGERASDGTRCIGSALAEVPAGPFAPLGEAPLICNPDEGGDIDPASFVDDDGQLYLLYKSNGPGEQPSIVWLQAVADDGVTLVGSRQELLRSDLPEENGVVEAPVLVRRPSQYVLFYSIKAYTDADYQTTYATAPSLTGPYTKSGEPLITRTSFEDPLDGPGGADVTTGTDGQHVFFHGWIGRTPQLRAFYAIGLDWKDERPVLVAP